MCDLERVRARYRQFAEDECRGYSEHYYHLSLEIAADDRLVRFIARMPVIQPNLFLAALQYLVGVDEMPRTAAQARSLVESRREEVEGLMRSRRTQTNEPGRCATILPALPKGPLALVEVGASAGLCLLVDEYAYEYGDRRVGPRSSPVRIRCVATGSPPLPAAVPQVAWRGGLDINPLDVHDDQDSRWLLSLVWPGHAERRERLSAAIGLARLRGVRVSRGDLASDLLAFLAGVPAEATLVVFHTAVLVYVNEENRRRFANSLAEVSKQRDVVWISNESAGVVPEITALAPPVRPADKLLGRTHFRDGERSDEFLAVAHTHGAELHWYAR
ncbi:MAG: DUF2332 domain-containing protein [Pirellulales bacterium]